MVPNKTGIEVCRSLRGLVTIRDIPIILATTCGEEENRAAGFEAGCDEYVTKPLDGPDLLAKVRSLLATAARAA